MLSKRIKAATARTKTAAQARLRAARKVPFVAQLTPTDCGVACLSSVLAYHGRHVPIHDIRAVLGGGRNGVNARQILAAARAFELRARGVAIEPDKLKYLPAGSILHWDLNHFVVYEQGNASGIQIVDPGMGRRFIPIQEVAKSLSGVALIFEPGEAFKPADPPRKDRLKRYGRWIFSVRGIWLKVALTSLFLQLLTLSIPGLMGAIVDKVVPRRDQQLLLLVSCGFLIVSSFHFLSTLLRSRILLELRTKVESRMSLDFVEHLLALPYGFFQQRTAGDLIMRLNSQVAIRELLTTGALSALLDGALVTIYFVLLLGAAPTLAWIALGLAALEVLIYLLASKKNSRLVIEGLASQAKLEGYQVEMLSGIEALKSMGITDRALSRWNNLYVDSLNRAISRGLLDGTFQSLIGTLHFCGPIALMLAGANLVLTGSLSLGTMLGLSALGAGFLDPVANLVGAAMKLSQLKGYMERIEDVLDTPREANLLSGQSAAEVTHAGAMSVRGLSFSYPGEPRPTLENVNLDIEAGQCVAIVGASGSGKSTLARLLAGLYTPASGEISFGGIALPQWNLSVLRDRLGIVAQDTRLFSGSIRDNVTMFDSAYNQDDVELACRIACLHDSIEQMPMRYDTVLADGGSSLSGGQRQRLALARALIRRPAVLILDEATSALDTITERAVQTNLRELRCTRVVVAHRLSTIVEADQIALFEQGHLVALGRHDELVQTSAEYRALLAAQLDQHPRSSDSKPHLAPIPNTHVPGGGPTRRGHRPPETTPEPTDVGVTTRIVGRIA